MRKNTNDRNSGYRPAPEQYESDKPNEETTGEPDEAPPEEQTQPDSLFQH